MNIIVASLITLGVIGLVAAIVLYFVAQKFKVEEDPRIDEVESVLPGANCGGCGYPGCRGFADACVKATSLEGKLCPVGGQPVMSKVATILGMAVSDAKPKVAVVRCNGSCANRPKKNNFDGAKSCRISNQLYAGETGCSFGCLGYGDCVEVCKFNAIHINEETGLPVVDDDKCTACGACVKICPKHVIELRDKGVKNRRVFVSCINKDKGGVARKACSAACIGCGKCAKVCPFGAITVENNLAYIDFNLCRLCRKCVAECPTGAIHDVNFPTPAPAAQKPVAKPIEPTAKSAEPVAKPIEPTTKSAEPTTKPAEPATKPADSVAKPSVDIKQETISNTDNVKVENQKIDAPIETNVVVEEAKVVEKPISVEVEKKADETTADVKIEVEAKHADDSVEIVVEEKVPTSETPVVETPVVEVPVVEAPTIDTPNPEKIINSETTAIEKEESAVVKSDSENKSEQSDADDVDISKLIDPEMRVVPREKKEKKIEKPTAEQQTLF